MIPNRRADSQPPVIRWHCGDRYVINLMSDAIWSSSRSLLRPLMVILSSGKKRSPAGNKLQKYQDNDSNSRHEIVEIKTWIIVAEKWYTQSRESGLSTNGTGQLNLVYNARDRLRLKPYFNKVFLKEIASFNNTKYHLAVIGFSTGINLTLRLWVVAWQFWASLNRVFFCQQWTTK